MEVEDEEEISENNPQNIFLSHIPEKELINPPQINNNSIKVPQNLSDSQKNLFVKNKKFIESNTWKWKTSADFKFSFPPSIFVKERRNFSFPKITNKNEIEYEKDNYGGNKLKEKELKQIWDEGSFEIKSKYEGFPYKWRISSLFIKGIKNIKLRYLKDLSISFYFIYKLKDRFLCQGYEKIFNNSYCCSLYHLFSFFYDLLDLFIGLPNYDESMINIEKKIQLDELNEFIENHKDFNFAFYDNKNYTQLYELDQKFDLFWNSRIKRKILKELKKQDKTKNQILIELNEQRKKEFMNFLTKEKNYSNYKNIFPNIDDFYYSAQIIKDEKFLSDELKAKKIKIYEEQLSHYYIKDLCQSWHNNKMSKYIQSVENEIKDEMEKKIKKQIETKPDPSMVYYYNTNNEKELPDKINKLKKAYKEPYKSCSITRMLPRPYEIRQEESPPYNYYLKRETYYYIKTSWCCWRLIFFIIKLFSSFFNFNLIYYRIMFSSMFGIKALFILDLYQDYSIDRKTGEVSLYRKTFTFPLAIKTLYESIKRSREQCIKEQKGKNGGGVKKFFNIFYNYVIKMLVIGSLLIILYPSLILINSFICLCLIILSPLISFGWNLLVYVLSLILYNKYGKIKRLPIFQIFFVDLLFSSIFQFITCTLSIIIQPLLSIFFLIYSHIHFLLRYIYDSILFFIVKHFWKIPIKESLLVTIISGPNLIGENDQNTFFDLSNKDIMILVIAEVEKVVMNKYKEKMDKKIREPCESVNKVKLFYESLGLRYEVNKDAKESVEYYEKNLDKQINEKSKFYPPDLNLIKDKIKFTEQRLDDVITLVENYISLYNKKNKNKGNDLIKKGVKEEKIFELSKNILENIFGKNIFKTIDESDENINVIVLENVYQDNLDDIAIKVLEEFNGDERKKNGLEIEKLKKFPKLARFSDIFEEGGPLFINLGILSIKERKDLFEKNKKE